MKTIIIAVVGLIISCKKNVDKSTPSTKPPVVTTKPIVNISFTSAVSGGEIVNETSITDKGIIWSTDSSSLTVSNPNKISNGAGRSNFTDTIQNLQSEVTYYIRAYATNSSGTGYGKIIAFTTLEPHPSVYLAGYNGSSAAYWKNGKLFILKDGTYAHSIFVSGNDVYVAGENNTGKMIATLWKNGVAMPFTDGSNAAVANSIYVVGNDVYVAGYELKNNNTNLPIAKYWKNNVAVPLTAGTDENIGIAYSIVVVGSDVYVAGHTANLYTGHRVATYWKNGVAIPLSDSNTVIGSAQSIFVKDNDVYVAGQEKPGLGIAGIPVAKYWKNGVGVNLTDGTEFAGAYSVFVTGSDVYVSGYEYKRSTGYSIAKYWKNGTPFSLTDGNSYGNAYSICVFDSNVYVAGGTGDNFNAKCWNNSVSMPLQISSEYSRSVSIFIK